MRWLADHKDVVSVTLASVAVVLSFVSFFMNRRQRRQDAFLRIHELLISPDAQHGRHLLYVSARRGEFPPEDSNDFRLMNRALSIHNTLGMYVRRRVVPRGWVLDAWHHSLQDMRAGAEAFIGHRQTQQHGWRPWADLGPLMDQADRYKSTMSCCRLASPVAPATPTRQAVQQESTVADEPEPGSKQPEQSI